MKKREEAEMRREEGELQRQERERMKVEKEREREWRRAALEKERADVDLMAGGEEKLEKEVALWLKEVKFPLAFVFVADRCLISPPPSPLSLNIDWKSNTETRQGYEGKVPL